MIFRRILVMFLDSLISSNIQCSQFKWQEAIDSRTFGPIHMNKIVGRVLYCMRSAVDHNRVLNSKESMFFDSPVLEMEHDVDEMAKSHKASEIQF
ncbi:putative peptidase S24/S26A/S26B/S26C, peptidase S24/S26, beta-ribbon domain-containing protein [Medicago truncatula]|uniref:Peptidase S24/S26A/S26B/S26C family protein n=1 Tax=Medicago truncatula TaxID=3880 RepID=A0A072VM66_MEDTR|nr:peptidase S24/S26A/S26B/S26C family protein [Medicago truncatula]RHN80026.1 putative peptidase S24/S26A/S26B/S26C, peptidase S24/S26, beta-ribbon domain-containing protein [Medicago truncatula]